MTQFEDTLNENFDFIWKSEQIENRQVALLLNDIQDSLCFEVIDLYLPTDSIPQDDFLILDDSLNSRGFIVTSSGRGNWEKGPRLISLNLENEFYYCRLDKLYYTDLTERHRYRVTERVAFLTKRNGQTKLK